MTIRKYHLSMQELPVDLFADPDGAPPYEQLVTAAGLDPDSTPPPLVGALTTAWEGHPEGSAVVLGAQEGVAVVVVVHPVETGAAASGVHAA